MFIQLLSTFHPKLSPDSCTTYLDIEDFKEYWVRVIGDGVGDGGGDGGDDSGRVDETVVDFSKLSKSWRIVKNWKTSKD